MTRKILTVDDAIYMRMMLRKILEAEEYEVIEAADGAEGVKQYQEQSPDVVLMDITMPNMDGIEATRQIVGQDPQAKVIICSALGQQQMVLEALKAGARDYIVKPFQPERVKEAVQKCAPG